MATPPPPAELPLFSLAPLKGVPVQIVVLDQRSGERDPAWTERIVADLRTTLTSSGARVASGATTRFEVRLLRGRSHFENRQWKGCAELAA
jgi:hypothetical protein